MRQLCDLSQLRQNETVGSCVNWAGQAKWDIFVIWAS